MVRCSSTQVANPLTCSEIAIRLQAHGGEPSISLTIGHSGSSSRLTVRSDSFGSDGIRVCCSEFLAVAPTWDGFLTATVTARTVSVNASLVLYCLFLLKILFTIVLMFNLASSALIPVSDWHFNGAPDLLNLYFFHANLCCLILNYSSWCFVL